MSTSTATATKQEALGRDYAVRLVLTAIGELDGIARLTDIADHLASSGLDTNEIYTLMATNPDRFVNHDRRWAANIAAAHERVATAAAVVGLVQGFGAPMTLKLLAVQCANMLGRPKEYFETYLRRLVLKGDDLFFCKGDHVGLTAWLYVEQSEDDDDDLFYNDLKWSDVDPYREAAASVDWEQLNAPLVFLRAVGEPVDARVVGYFASRALRSSDPYVPPRYDAVKVFDTVYSSDEYVYGPDGKWHAIADAKKWLAAATRLLKKLESTIEIEDATPLEVKPDELDQMVARVLSSEDATLASDLLADMYGVEPGSRTYADDLNTVVEALRSRPEVLWVGGIRFRKPGTEPLYVHEVPEILRYEKYEFYDDDGVEIDLELEPEAFSSSLRKELGHALAQDVLDDEVGPVHKHLADEVRCVVKAHHKELGTFPLAQIPNGWLPAEPKLQEIILEDPKGRRLPVWVNTELRLMFGLFPWYLEQEIESGAVFTLHKTGDPNRLLFRWMEEPDPLCFISFQRMEELRDLQERADTLSTFEILAEVMSRYNKGADFITIVTEVNVVRRVTRSMIASILSGYHCFYQRAGSPVWHYDAKKVQQGADKSKRKYAKK
ncbi:MAG: hypothetical protein HRF45_10545 [Fimbriimonadia bacterium]